MFAGTFGGTDAVSTLTLTLNKVSSRGQRDNMPPDDGSSTVAKIAADLRTYADGSAVHTSLVDCGGSAAGSQRACSLGSCTMGQMDRRTDRRIALF